MLIDSRSTPLALAAALALLGLTVSCDETSSRTDGSPEDGWTGTCPGSDKTIDFKSALPLAANTDSTDYICPTKDRDFFKVTVPAGHKLLNIDIKYVTAAPKLNLTYQIYTQGETLVEAAPGSSSTSFKNTHCINPGTYLVVVKDDADSGFDAKNPYIFSYTTEADKDTAEPNDTTATAKTLTGSATGLISCAGDVDYFKYSGSAGLLQVQLKAASTTPVDLQYTIYDSNNTPVASETISDGTKPNAALDVIHALPTTGTYYIAVEDSGGNDADTVTKYTLTVTKKSEPDAQDQSGRNDSPAKATSVGTYSSGTLTKTFTGQLASKGDVDYFVVDGVAGASVNKPAVMEVILDYSAGQVALDPSFSYIYGDPAEACTKDACCVVLGAKSSCKTNLECLRKSFSCIKKGDSYCNDSTCSPSPSSICAGEQACAGAALCLPDKTCGSEFALRWAKDKKTAVTVKTSQLLLHPGPWYIRVGDLKNDEYEYGRSYTLKVTVQWDTDGANELDTEYFADRCLLVEDKLLGSKEWELHVAQAAKKLAAKTISVGTSYTGQLSYEGDIDFYKFNNPCPNADCTLAIAYNVSCAPSSGGVTRYCQDPKEVAKGPGLEHIFAIRRTSGDDPYAEIWTGFEAKPGASGEWGATAAGGNLCVYSYKSHGSEPYYLTVEDTAHNFWSLSCKYTFTIKKVADGCVAPCKVHPVSGNCGA